MLIIILISPDALFSWWRVRVRVRTHSGCVRTQLADAIILYFNFINFLFFIFLVYEICQQFFRSCASLTVSPLLRPDIYNKII